MPNDYGTELTLKPGNPGDTINPSFFQGLDLSPAADSTCINEGAECYEQAILGCAGGTWKIGDFPPKQTGNMMGPTMHGTQDLINLDLDRRLGSDQQADHQQLRRPPIYLFDARLQDQSAGRGRSGLRPRVVLGDGRAG